MRHAADCTHANTFKAPLALTGNTSSPKCQSFLLGLGTCPRLNGSTVTFSVELSIKNPHLTEQKPAISQPPSFHGAWLWTLSDPEIKRCYLWIIFPLYWCFVGEKKKDASEKRWYRPGYNASPNISAKLAQATNIPTFTFPSYLNVKTTSVCSEAVAFRCWSVKLEVINLQRLQSHGRAFWVTRMTNWPVMVMLCITCCVAPGSLLSDSFDSTVMSNLDFSQWSKQDSSCSLCLLLKIIGAPIIQTNTMQSTHSEQWTVSFWWCEMAKLKQNVIVMVAAIISAGVSSFCLRTKQQ